MAPLTAPPRRCTSRRGAPILSRSVLRGSSAMPSVRLPRSLRALPLGVPANSRGPRRLPTGPHFTTRRIIFMISWTCDRLGARQVNRFQFLGALEPATCRGSAPRAEHWLRLRSCQRVISREHERRSLASARSRRASAPFEDGTPRASNAPAAADWANLRVRWALSPRWHSSRTRARWASSASRTSAPKLLLLPQMASRCTCDWKACAVSRNTEIGYSS